MRTTAVLLGGVLLACSPPLDSVALEFDVEPLDQEELSAWSVARTEAGDHRVTVRRALRVPGSCERLQGHLARSGTVFTLRVGARDAGAPEAPDALCGYTAVVRGLPSGEYRLRVVHAPAVTRHGADLVMDHPIHIR